MSIENMPWLSLVIWVPIITGIVTLLIGDKNACRVRMFALLASLVTLVLSLPLYGLFNSETAAMQFVELKQWIPTLGINYHLGVDGLSMPFILLTSFMTVVVVIAGWDVITYKRHQYLGAFLIMAGLMNGVFAAMDSILFYVFFEAMLIPMFLIIGIWGGPNRVQAALKFFLYTFLGSIFLLVGIIYLYMQSNNTTFSIANFADLDLSLSQQKWLLLAFLAGFAVKVPMWPVHTWLPSAHVEAPTGGSVILAAITLKIGGYGFLRFMLPIVPEGIAFFAPMIIAMSIIAIIYISFVALAQKDMKKLIAYSSIAHMGFVTLGFVLPVAFLDAPMAANQMAIQGGMMQMISHGFVSAAMFLSIGVLYDRVHSREIADYGGVINSMPIFGAFFIFFAMANSGLPGTSGFIGEFWVLLASFHYGIYITIAVATSLILSAGYNLWLTKRVILGEAVHQHVKELKDLNGREYFLLAMLAIFIIVLGVWPAPLANVMQASIDNLLHSLPMINGQP
ncbi:NADH-quinone oxidoreductase subunit M [Wohlfahrtiimonas chitiniclastica]|uniref:NADH-quinone oxidoreductase subunit M n=1 Tax=Wohlfahrtiimonas chitiniclastica TaxID=400946 RepID=UPI000B97E380|nr:NADH-quinone oxidoreductase subunit M [Wohlfahrtiimonas chitiniclastica]OYQ87071.1 NADH-quinone oxidoreductase subunit M [Wohlfahrtiimonas chitiniclastica]